MKRTSSFAALLLAATIATISCQELTGGSGKGIIQVELSADLLGHTKGLSRIPDPGNFVLAIADSNGKDIYNGTYSASPEHFEVSAGSYTVSVRSGEFTEPMFDSPQWGDTQVVRVSSGQTVSVFMNCTQLNSGIRLLPDATFRTAYPQATLYIQGTDGSLMYSYNEKRTAYFSPGVVSVILANPGKSEAICSRQLEAQEILSLGLSANLSASSDGKIRVEVDTTRNWISESHIVGGAGSSESAYSVTEARQHIGETDAWVEGYIAGIATTTSKFSFSGPFAKNTNMVIGLRSNSTDPEYLMSIELPKGDIRDALNLMDNPDLLGHPVRVCGEIVGAYYGIPGVKGPKDYEL
ncbi:MAG: DUF4493 domain-containing protein [Bacteroidales bacterium]|nr:DUF4493 domain-containing protein [Bacteroidales bacterium]